MEVINKMVTIKTTKEIVHDVFKIYKPDKNFNNKWALVEEIIKEINKIDDLQSGMSNEALIKRLFGDDKK